MEQKKLKFHLYSIFYILDGEIIRNYRNETAAFVFGVYKGSWMKEMERSAKRLRKRKCQEENTKGQIVITQVYLYYPSITLQTWGSTKQNNNMYFKLFSFIVFSSTSPGRRVKQTRSNTILYTLMGGVFHYFICLMDFCELLRPILSIGNVNIYVDNR